MRDEETQGKKKADDHPNVKHWIRSLAYEIAGGFSMSETSKRFTVELLAIN